ncbi:ExbD/TolR family protein [Candidatus Cardinium hertigii]|uniref:Biopolymer transporter ExbD n=1 Tax=Candidatus Cardinium hertigii TaxID=247481 RepID=A0A2Z3LJS2_9BACT|nr:biopolymer transporter ExbD [Candidatus Cardinium hertigii]AWN82300.1 hypothetical protein DK880_01003 [Candidatus Cardinium hertigii]
MLIKVKNKIDSSFNMASMTDVLCLLLIFVLIGSKYHTQAIPINLPLSTNKKTAVAPVHITVTAALQYYIEGNIVPFPQLEQLLQAKLAKASHKMVVLHMDRRLAIAHMVKVADIAHRLEASVALATALEPNK